MTHVQYLFFKSITGLRESHYTRQVSFRSFGTEFRIPISMPRVVREYKEQARSRIVAAAREVLRRKGVSGSTMEEIAREIGVSKGALYLYFRSKTHLLEAVLTQQRNDMLQRYERLIEGGDVAEGIAGSIDAVFSGDFDPLVWNQLMVESATDPEVRAMLRRDEREDARQLKAFLRRLAKQGRIPPMDDPELIADVIILLLGGTLIEVSFRGEVADRKRKLVRALRLVLGLSSGAPAGAG